MYDRHRDGSADYYGPSGSVRRYQPPYYSDEDRSDGRYYSSESPDETDSESEDYRERGPALGYYATDNRVAPHIPDSESLSEGGVPDSESETETEDYSDRDVPEGYESGSTHDRDDYDSYGGSYGDWDDHDDDDYGEYDGLFVLPFTRLPNSVCSFLPGLRRRFLRLLLLDEHDRSLRRLNLHHFGGSHSRPWKTQRSVYLSCLLLWIWPSFSHERGRYEFVRLLSIGDPIPQTSQRRLDVWNPNNGFHGARTLLIAE